MRLTGALALLVMTGQVLASSGYVHGSDHCYYFSAPVGWEMSNRALASEGVPMAFYPKGTTWNSAPYAMYSRPIELPAGKGDPIRQVTKDVVAMYAEAGEAVEARKIESINSEFGESGELWAFTGISSGGLELVAYFPGENTINYFVAQIGSETLRNEAKEALLELAGSYREANDCKPCGESNVCGASR